MRDIQPSEMASVAKMTLYPIHAVGQPFVDDEPFDDALLPAEIIPGVRVEKVAGLLTPKTFEVLKRSVAPDKIESFANIDYAIVHHFRSPNVGTGDIEQKSMQLVRTLSALLRILRPMRQRFFAIQGRVEPGGEFIPGPLDGPEDYVELPEAHKLFHLRPRDLKKFQQLAPNFLHAMDDEYWGVRLAVQFHDLGHYTFQRYWKLSWFSWIAGLESLYTTDDPEHRGQLVVKERIKHLLGASTLVYELGDIPDFLPQPEQTVSGVIGPIYKLRNIVIHGKPVPGSFYAEEGRIGLDGPLRRVEELVEVLSFLLRKSIQIVLEKNLIENFKDEGTIRAYFSGLGLTRTKLLRRRDIAHILDKHGHPLDLTEILRALNRQLTRPRKPFTIDEVEVWIAEAVAAGEIALGEDARYSLPV
jgi:hypothetical protein